HTFTPVLNNQIRTVDIGILFDPNRKAESEFCRKLFDGLEQSLPYLSIKLNEPYKGTDDGFTTYLRTKFYDDEYLGIEIEVNQKYLGTEKWEMIAIGLKEILFELLYESDL
ncbi:MAG TPA: N-formylglutamate amidohydrolase, partial [Chryseolinea sp.]|nr:N-formylglutamate amidohydrolase [Chryseolinea sp.]